MTTSAAHRPSRLRRLLAHRWFDERDARRLLGPAALARLTERVRQAEQRHGGEIRLCIEASLPLAQLWRRVGARQRALDIFSELRVWDTEHNNGVLIYLLLAEHAIEIVADRGLRDADAMGRWPAIVAEARQAFAEGAYERGLQIAVDGVAAVLAATYAHAEPKARNELPDTPELR